MAGKKTRLRKLRETAAGSQDAVWLFAGREKKNSDRLRHLRGCLHGGCGSVLPMGQASTQADAQSTQPNGMTE
jgi:hypothetical protein